MDRQTALRALGLPPNPPRGAVRRAFPRLRDHLMERSRTAGNPAASAARLAELAALEAALGADLADGRRPLRPLLGLGVGALVVVLAWGVGSLASRDAGTTSPVAAAPETAPEAPAETLPARPAELMVSAPVDGARFALAGPTGDALLSAPADGALHTLEPAPGGPLELVVSHPDCGPGAAADIALPPGERLETELQPCPATGWLVVRSNVSQDRVVANGRALGSTGPRLHPLSVGDYRVSVEKPGYSTWSERTRIDPGQVVVLRARLRRQAAERPSTRIDSEAARTAADITQDKGGTRGWFDSVSTWMVAHHDANGTGLIDDALEVDGIPCNTWQALEISYETGRLGAPMSRLYGFDGSRWVPGALGFDVRVRDQAYERMRACGLR